MSVITVMLGDRASARERERGRIREGEREREGNEERHSSCPVEYRH